MRVGDIDIASIRDGVALIPLTDPLIQTPVEAWAPHQQFLRGDDLELILGGFLIRTAGHLALVDTGVGPMDKGHYHGGAFLDSLAAVGVAPTDVTDVLFTHLHVDHVGWSTQQGAVVFTNATYRCHRADWDHFVGTDERSARKLGPLTDRMEFWDSSGPLLPGVDTMVAPGHTPGSTIIVVSSGTDRVLMLGDVVHCPLELVDDEWAGIGDVDPQLALRTRNALARELAGTDTPMAGAHFPGLEFGRLLRGEGARQWVVP